jgi:hypothetical protein
MARQDPVKVDPNHYKVEFENRPPRASMRAWAWRRSAVVNPSVNQPWTPPSNWRASSARPSDAQRRARLIAALLAVVPRAGIDEVSFDQRVQTKACVQLPREQEAGIGGHRRAAELDAKVRIEREANRARLHVTIGWCPLRQRGTPESRAFAGH